jgi:hypothetical protein
MWPVTPTSPDFGCWTAVRFGNGRKAEVTVTGTVNIHMKVTGRVNLLYTPGPIWDPKLFPSWFVRPYSPFTQVNFDLQVSYIETTGDGESMADFVASMAHIIFTL